MVFGRLKGAVTDAAETLRRAFADPPCQGWTPGLESFLVRPVEPLACTFVAGCPEFLADRVEARLGFEPLPGPSELAFHPLLRFEEAFARWAAGARVCEMSPLTSYGQRLSIPVLPRRAAVMAGRPDPFQPRTRTEAPRLERPRVFAQDPGVRAPRVYPGLELALGLPFAITGEDIQALPKPVWMRYTLQIVKASGENIRNLDVLGIYRIPIQGVGAMRHEPKSGKLVIQLGREASGSPRSPFMLARRKDDRTIVSCYLEGG